MRHHAHNTYAEMIVYCYLFIHESVPKNSGKSKFHSCQTNVGYGHPRGGMYLQRCLGHQLLNDFEGHHAGEITLQNLLLSRGEGVHIAVQSSPVAKLAGGERFPINITEYGKNFPYSP